MCQDPGKMGSSRFDVVCSCFTMRQENFGKNTRGWFLYCSAWTNLLVAVETHEGYIPLMSLCVKTRGKWGQVDLMSYVHVSQWGKHILEYHKIVCLFKKDG